MSEKSKASTLAALALAGVVAITAPGPAASQDTNQTNTTSQATTQLTQANTQQQQAIRYMDVTARNDGWVLAQSLGVSGSSERKIVIISYADAQTTRAFYDTAVQFTRPPQSLPIFGVVRAPQHPTQPNRNGFDIYINGVSLGEIPNPDTAYSSTQFFAAIMDNVKREYYASRAAQAGPIATTTTAMLARNTTGGNQSSGGSASGGGTGGGGGSSAGGNSSGDSSAGGKNGGTEVAAIVFNPDL